ncbi:hypothetical protein ACFZB9_15175 [Kitasatospora sp. NPDC008050]
MKPTQVLAITVLGSYGNPNCPLCGGTGVKLGSEPGKVQICTG